MKQTHFGVNLRKMVYNTLICKKLYSLHGRQRRRDSDPKQECQKYIKIKNTRGRNFACRKPYTISGKNKHRKLLLTYISWKWIVNFDFQDCKTNYTQFTKYIFKIFSHVHEIIGRKTFVNLQIYLKINCSIQ